MAELAQGLGLNLTDALARDVELLAHFLEGAGAAIDDAEAQLENLLLAGGKGVQHLFKLLAQKGEGSGLRGLGRVLVGDEVAEVGVLLLADGGLRLTGSWAIFRMSRTLSTGMSISLAISSAEGSWPSSCRS